MSETLGEIVVTGTYEGMYTNWYECFEQLQFYTGGIAYGYALSYLYSDEIFWDLNNNLAWMTPEQCQKRLRLASSWYDNIRRGSNNGADIVNGYWAAKDEPYREVSEVEVTYYGVFKAAAHWLWGEGKPLRIKIDALNLSLPIERIARDSNPLLRFISDRRQPGYYSYDSGSYGYETYEDEHLPPQLIVGGISLRTTGTLTRGWDGSFSFVGETRAFNDFFNMDKRPGRPWWADQVVDTFHTIGGNDYTIVIDGAIPHYFTGR